MLLPEEQVWGRRLAMPLSETEGRSRGRLALDRDRASREGGVQPPSKAESRSRVVRPSSETESHSRGDRPMSEADLYRGGGGWADCLTGRGSAGSFRARV
jgi:hypothetical protein